MEQLQFIELNAVTVFLLVLIGFIGGMVSGFIGSGGAFVLTPAMMSLGAPAMVAVASNICHKFPKALVGAIKRHKYGQVDVKLGLILGIFAEAGMLAGKQVMSGIKKSFGAAGTDLYVSAVFIVVLAIVGGYVLRDYRRLKRLDEQGQLPMSETPRLARWVHSLDIPGTMIYFPSAGAKLSLLFVIPIGFLTGMLAATIAVGGFIGVPAMIYLLGVPALMASGTELVIAFVMGLGGTIFYGLEGAVDVRLSMLILLGSLFGIQLGAIGTTYVKDYQVKRVMAVIMLTVLFSRFFYLPGYLSELGMIAKLTRETVNTLKTLGDSVLAVALILGAVTVLTSLTRGIAEHRKLEMQRELAASLAPAAAPIAPVERLARILVATDGSEYSRGALVTADALAQASGAELWVSSVAVVNPEYATVAPELRALALEKAQAAVREGLQGLKTASRSELIVEADDPYRGIVDAAEEARVDLIVIGRRGRRGLARDLIGDATAKVIGHASCPVLVCPRGAQLKDGPLLAATDGSRYGDLAAWYAGKLAARLGRDLIVVSAVLPDQTDARRREAVAAIERVETAFKGGLPKVKGIVASGRAHEVILTTMRQIDVAMLVIGSHGRTGIERLLLGSVAERVIGFSDRPVLVVR